jgi:hypothetical protein
LHEISKHKTEKAVVDRFEKDFEDVLQMNEIQKDSQVSFTQLLKIMFDCGFIE